MNHFFVRPEHIWLESFAEEAKSANTGSVYRSGQNEIMDQDGNRKVALDAASNANRVSEADVLGKAILTGGDVNHVQNVLRMNVGEELLLSDGEGHDYHCRIAAFEEERVVCDILNTTVSLTEPALKITLFQGLPKADKLEFIIQKAVELGVYDIVPVQTVRTVVKYDAKKQKNRMERWQKIAESAAKQSRRGIVPEVRPILRFSEALQAAEPLDALLFPYENFKDMKATRAALAKLEPGMHIGIFIGPEGGFADEEVEQGRASGAQLISLGNRILRTETAPLMLLSVLLFPFET